MLGGTRKKGGYPSGKEKSKKRSSSVLISAVFYSSHGMRRETTCNDIHFSLAFFCLMETNPPECRLSVCNNTPYTGCIEPGVNWDMLLRQGLSEHWKMSEFNPRGGISRVAKSRRIPNISGWKSGHFQIVAANLSRFGIKRLQHCGFMTKLNSKRINLRRKQAFVQYLASYCVKIPKIHILDIL